MPSDPAEGTGSEVDLSPLPRRNGLDIRPESPLIRHEPEKWSISRALMFAKPEEAGQYNK